MLENEPALRDSLRRQLERRGWLEHAEVWSNFYQAFSPDRREASLVRLHALATGDTIVFEHVFVSFRQTEQMIHVLSTLPASLTIASFTDLRLELQKFLNRGRSELYPEGTDGTNGSAFKQRLNGMLLDCLQRHQVLEMDSFGTDDERVLPDEGGRLMAEDPLDAVEAINRIKRDEA